MQIGESKQEQSARAHMRQRKKQHMRGKKQKSGRAPTSLTLLATPFERERLPSPQDRRRPHRLSPPHAHNHEGRHRSRCAFARSLRVRGEAPSAAAPTFWPVAGLTTSKVLPLRAGRSLPPMKWYPSGLCVWVGGCPRSWLKGRAHQKGGRRGPWEQPNGHWRGGAGARCWPRPKGGPPGGGGGTGDTHEIPRQKGESWAREGR